MSKLITYAALADAKRAGTLVQWLAEMTSVERVEAAQVCAANGRPSLSVSDWLRIFGELMDAHTEAQELAQLLTETHAALAVAVSEGREAGAALLRCAADEVTAKIRALGYEPVTMPGKVMLWPARPSVVTVVLNERAA